MKQTMIGLVALAVSGAITAEAASGDSAKQAIEYCQAMSNSATEIARAKQSGRSINEFLDAVDQMNTTFSVIAPIKERAARIYAADNPHDEVRAIAAECMIAHRLVKVK